MFALVILSILSIIISMLIAYYSWYRNRSVFKIEHGTYFLHPGSQENKNCNEKLEEKLSSGQYMILSTNPHQDKGPIGYDILLAKIKK